VSEHQSALRLDSVCRLPRRGILAVDAARVNEIAYPTGSGDRIYMLETFDVDALATPHGVTSLHVQSIQT
jgi:hypothetical protein